MEKQLELIRTILLWVEEANSGAIPAIRRQLKDERPELLEVFDEAVTTWKGTGK